MHFLLIKGNLYILENILTRSRMWRKCPDSEFCCSCIFLFRLNTEIYRVTLCIHRNSRRKCSVKKGVLINFAKFLG